MAKEKIKGNLAENRKAFHDYFIEETFEAGLSLVGTEVKSIRAGKVNIGDSYAYVKNREVFICNMHVSPYEQGNIFNRDPIRDRKCLLHKTEILKMQEYTSSEGYTLIPLSLYLVRGRVKVKIGVAKGKHNYDKRESLKEKQVEREVQQHFKENNKY